MIEAIGLVYKLLIREENGMHKNQRKIIKNGKLQGIIKYQKNEYSKLLDMGHLNNIKKQTLYGEKWKFAPPCSFPM